MDKGVGKNQKVSSGAFKSEIRVYIIRRVVALAEGSLAGACACTLNIKRAVDGAQKAVVHTVRVNVVSRGRLCRVDALGVGALASAGM